MLLNSRFFRLVTFKKTSGANLHKHAVAGRRVVSVALMILLWIGSVPPAMAGLLAREALSQAREGAAAMFQAASDHLSLRRMNGLHLLAWPGSLAALRAGASQESGQNRGMPTTPTSAPAVRPQRSETKAARESKVASILINPDREVILQSREPMVFSANPVDGQGNPIHGLQVEWESSDKQVVFVTSNGQATAGKPGRAILTARAGKAKEKVRVTVIEGVREKFGGKKKENSKRQRPRSSRNMSDFGNLNAVANFESNKLKGGERKRHAAHAQFRARRSWLQPIIPLRDQMDDPLPDDETPSLYSAANSVGSPPGKKTPGALTAAAAIDSTESPSSENFSFALPMVSLPGRGLDVSLSLIYNSRTFNKSVDSWDGSTWMTYDVDSGWPAAGFRLGYGQIEDQGSFGFTLTDADGTRHALAYTSPYNYDTTDGTFIHFYGGRGWGSLYYANGTRVDYGAAGGGYRSYPTKIVDRNGNYILIGYVGGIGPKIASVTDTLERHVYFYYASNGDLVTITSPGLTGQAERQMVRFYYQDITISQSGLFQSDINVDAPATSHVIKYIYFPNATESGDAHLGYRYDYSAYGMIYQIAQLRGMTVDSSALDQTGWVSSEGAQAAQTAYNYPTTPSDLADAPSFTRRTDDWIGRTTGMPGTGEAPYYTFTVDQANGVSTVTAPDGTVTETHSIVAPGLWNDGLVNQTIVKQGANGPTLARTDNTWELDANGHNARPQQLQMTNDAGQTTTVVITYSTYNNVISTSTRGFDGVEVRRVETDYQTDPTWTSRYLLHLPLTTRVYAGGSATPASRVDYAYDTDGTNLIPRNDIVMHEPSSDPFAQTEENCNWECNGYDEWGNCNWEWVCHYYSPYVPATDKRGNVTSVTTYADAASGGGAITNTTTYDIAGNVITAQVACCQQKSLGYSSSYFYAYPTSITSGAGPTLTTSIGYDFNTGLVTSTTDENSQVTYAYYNADSLRPEHVDYPDGGAVSYHYNDNLFTDAAGRQHSYAYTSTKLDSSRVIDSYRFFDGRGALTQTFDNWTQASGWSTQDIEYDAMGRAYRTGNPYYSAGYGAVGINPTNIWTKRTFDNLGRVTRIDMPSGDAQNPTATYATAEYAGVFTTVTDQAGKQHRQKSDALGRTVRVDEPDANGNLGPPDAPNQYTTYEYDALNNLIHIAQESQHRYFRYDSLSRLTHDREVELDAPYTTSDYVAGNNQWSRKTVYNSQGLVQDVYDARQINTHFVYDGLNRVSQINYYLPNGSPDPATPATNYYFDSQTLPTGAPGFDRGYSLGRLVAMTYGGSTATTGNYFGYDKMGRVVTHRQVTGANTYAMGYGYNLGGLLTSETYPTGRALSYAYDEGGRLSQVSENTAVYASGFNYEPHGGLSRETFGNGAVHSVAYNRALQVSEIKLGQSANGAELQRFNYTYGTVNQVDGSVDTTRNNGQIGRTDGYINGVKQWEQRFSYDLLARLSTAAEYQQGNNNQLTWQTQYTFDRYGNRFQSGSGNSGVGYVPVVTSDIETARNRFISTGATPINYDQSGNITQDLKFRGMNYSYDANGRQTFVERTDHTNQQTSVYDCGGQRVQTSANNMTRQIVYDIFGQHLADYANGTLERENIYRGGQLLMVVETPPASAPAPSGLVVAPSSTSITLNWSAASGATNYRVERKGAGGSFGLVGTTASPTFTDNGVSSGSAYLYKICAADGSGNCTSGYSNIALGAPVNFPTDPTIVTIADDPTGSTVTTMKAAHITELRSAVNAVRSLAGMSAAGWTNPTLTPGVSVISADDVRDVRAKLDEALTALGIQTSGYTDQTLAGAPNGTLIKGAHLRELRQRATSGSGNGSSCYKSISQFVKDFYQGALGHQPSSSELSQWTATLTQAQAQGAGSLLGAAQSLGATLFTSAEYINLNTSNAAYITDLYEAYLQRGPDSNGYNSWLAQLNGGASRTSIRQGFAFSLEFQNNVNALCMAASASSGIRYVLSDLQGSTRAVMNNNGVGTSAVIARHDYLPYGEEIWSGTGLRTSAQGFGAGDSIRQRYGLTERDEVTGLDHTWFRKYESLSGRLTSPDPYSGSMSISDSQSFNRYSYVQNDPVNFVDPSGLYEACVHQAMTQFLAKLSGKYSDEQAADLGRFAGDGPGGADSKEFAATSFKNIVKGFFGRGSAAKIHFASEATLARGIANFDGFVAAGNLQSAAFVLHSIQDVHGAHQGFHMPFGHFFSGHKPDRVIGDAKFLRAANETFQTLSGNKNVTLTADQVDDLIAAIIAGCGKKAEKLRIVQSVPIVGGLIGGGIGGGFGGGFGGGYPPWWYSMQEFLDWVDSIPIGDGYVTVSACVGSDCTPPTLTHELLHTR
jgi:RHS repeat-associated protein